MVPPPFQQTAGLREQWHNECLVKQEQWDAKQSQPWDMRQSQPWDTAQSHQSMPQMRDMQPPQSLGPRMPQSLPGWQALPSWQGELGPNLMPMDRPHEGSNPMQLPQEHCREMHQMAPPRSMQNMPPGNCIGQEFSGGGFMQNHTGSLLQNPYGPQGPPSGSNMQNIMGPSLQGSYASQNVPVMQGPAHQMSQMHSAQNFGPNMHMQVIALPAGSPPPEGAIPLGPDGQMGQSPHMQPPQMQHAPMQPPQMQPPQIQHLQNIGNMQMIAVPVGQAPPDGAIPIDQFSSASTTASTPPQSLCDEPRKESSRRGFKIKDPRTGLEVRAPGDEAAPAVTQRRMRIVNPKTGEEVSANL